MYRPLITIFALALMVGCANSPVSSSPDSQGDNPPLMVDGQCNATGVQSYVGQRWRDALDAELRRTSSSQVLRLLKPGQVMTLELNPYRLNAVLDAQSVITSLYCS